MEKTYCIQFKLYQRKDLNLFVTGMSGLITLLTIVTPALCFRSLLVISAMSSRKSDFQTI